ncbi:MAG: multiheme c-type cytochrome [Planctomycetota bacterium]
MRRRGRLVLASVLLLPLLALAALVGAEPYPSLFDADYVGSEACAKCHTQVYASWQHSPHAYMARPATRASVVGNFDDYEWHLPEAGRKAEDDERPVKCFQRDGKYFMAFWHGGAKRYVDFEIAYVVGYQYRQVYLTREADGVLRRLPLQWFTERSDFYPYWNYQENSQPDTLDLWSQMTVPNSAWNLFCGRCHTTHLEVLAKDEAHTRAQTRWTETGIACEACHGPGSHHVRYFEKSYVNRLAAFLKSKLRGEPVAYMATGPKLDKGKDLSVCGRCHGADIMMASQDAYRAFEPGYSKEGRVNDLSSHFYEFPMQPGRKVFTVECWDDGRPKGIGMLFRSFVESKCFRQGEVRCYDCHDPHQNKLPAAPGLLQPSPQSDDYCLRCHTDLRGAVAAHSHHEIGKPGSHCYDCHMPKSLHNHVGGYLRPTRTHDMSHIPNPSITVELGRDGAPNACDDCHADHDATWARDKVAEWWPKRG